MFQPAKSLLIIVATIMAVGAAARSLAQQRPATLSLRELQEIAQQENRDLKAARHRIREAEARLTQATAWPNPEAEFARSTDRPFNDEGEYATSVGFLQKFPISGRLARAKSVAQIDIALAREEIADQERLLRGAVRQKTRELVVINRRAKINADSKEVLQSLLNASEKRFERAEISQADLNLERIELQKLDLLAASLLLTRENMVAAINLLLGREGHSPLEVTDSLSIVTAPSEGGMSIDEILERRPDRRAAFLRAHRSEAGIELARAERFADWGIGVGYDRDRSSYDSPLISDSRDSYLSFRLSVPLPIWDSGRARIKEQEAARERAIDELAALDLSIRAEIASTHNALNRMVPILHNYENRSLKLARDNVALLHRSYAEGLVPVNAVIQAHQQLFELQQGYADLLREYVGALTSYETATALSDQP